MRAPGSLVERRAPGARRASHSLDGMDPHKTTLSVIIPAFNEEGRIAGTVETIRQGIQRWCADGEIIVVDDGSTDLTPQIMMELAAAEHQVRFFRHTRNRGKGAALRLGVRHSRGALVLLTDADLATPIDDLGRLLEEIVNGADLAIGSRAMPGARILVPQGLLRQYSGRLFSRLARLTLLPSVVDTQCGFKLFRGPVARSLFAQSVIDGYAIDVEILSLAAEAGLVIAEVPVVWSHVAGSKVRMCRDGFRMGWDLMTIWARRWLHQRPREAPHTVSAERVAQIP